MHAHTHHHHHTPTHTHTHHHTSSHIITHTHTHTHTHIIIITRANTRTNGWLHRLRLFTDRFTHMPNGECHESVMRCDAMHGTTVVASHVECHAAHANTIPRLPRHPPLQRACVRQSAWGGHAGAHSAGEAVDPSAGNTPVARLPDSVVAAAAPDADGVATPEPDPCRAITDASVARLPDARDGATATVAE
jgi:hypothetical protein